MSTHHTWPETLADLLAAHSDSVRVALPGRVERYNHLSQTADVAPLVPAGLPVVPSVPVAWPAGGGAYLQFPLTTGDTGLLICCDSDLRDWQRTGESGDAPDVASHGLSAAVFLPGLHSDAAKLPDCPAGAVLGGSDVRLGGPSATHPIARGDDVGTHLDTYLAAHSVWVGAVAGAVPALAAAAATMQAAIAAVRAALPGDLSSGVKVP